MSALLPQVLISPHLTGIPYGFLLVSSLCMLHQLFPTSTRSPLLQFTWSPIPESHLLKPSLPLLFLSPIPRIATILQIHSFFAILTSILTSSTLRAYHLNSLGVPNGFLTGSIRAVKYPPHHYQLHLSSTATTPTYFLIENFPWLSGPTGSPVSSESQRVERKQAFYGPHKIIGRIQ